MRCDEIWQVRQANSKICRFIWVTQTSGEGDISPLLDPTVKVLSWCKPKQFNLEKTIPRSSKDGLEDIDYWHLCNIEPESNIMNNKKIDSFGMKSKKPILSKNIDLVVKEGQETNIIWIKNSSSHTWNFCLFDKN